MTILLDLPCNLDAENSLLGALLLNNELIFKCNNLVAEHFYDHDNQIIFSEIKNAVGDGRTASIVLMGQKCRKEAISRALSYPAIKFVITELAEAITEAFRKRRVILSCQLATDLVNGGGNFSEASSVLRAELEVLSLEGRKSTTDKDITLQIIEDIKSNKQPTSTGLNSLDRAMDGGLYPGKSYGFLARMKVGKTTLAATISYNLAVNNRKHLFICGEMGAKEIHQRMLARYAEAFPSAFRTDYQNNPAFQLKLVEYTRTTSESLIYQNAPGLTFDQLKDYVTTAVYKDKIEGFILDYWQLVKGKGKTGMTEHLDEVAQWIADYSRLTGIWNITTGQHNREGEPRFGDGLKLAFDQVYTLHREDLSGDEAWLEMTDNRYTRWANIGSKESAGLYMIEKGPYFAEPLQAVVGIKNKQLIK